MRSTHAGLAGLNGRSNALVKAVWYGLHLILSRTWGEELLGAFCTSHQGEGVDQGHGQNR
jgi:hypothetical protein